VLLHVASKRSVPRRRPPSSTSQQSCSEPGIAICVPGPATARVQRCEAFWRLAVPRQRPSQHVTSCLRSNVATSLAGHWSSSLRTIRGLERLGAAAGFSSCLLNWQRVIGGTTHPRHDPSEGGPRKKIVACPSLAEVGSPPVCRLIRGVTGLTGRTALLVPWAPAEEFVRHDRQYYGPLCLGIGALVAIDLRSR